MQESGRNDSDLRLSQWQERLLKAKGRVSLIPQVRRQRLPSHHLLLLAMAEADRGKKVLYACPHGGRIIFQKADSAREIENNDGNN